MKNISLQENTPPQPTCEYNVLRDSTLDVAAGILITRMILGHYMTLCGLSNTMLAESLNVLFFYMPWFFFKSGMFCPASVKDTKQFLISNVKKFVIPFLFFSVLGTFVGFIFYFVTEQTILNVLKADTISFIKHGSTSWNAPLWFLLSLCFVRVSFNQLREKINCYLLLFLCLVFAILHHIFLSNHGVFWIGNICSGMFFYILGKEMRTIQYRRDVFLLSIIVLICIWLYRPTIVTMFGNFLLYNNGIYLLWYPFCLAGIIVFNNIVKFVPKVFEHYNFAKVGRYSISYYVVHYPLGLFICDFYYKYSNEVVSNNWELLFYLCLMWLGVLPFVTYIMNKKFFSLFIGK